MDMMGGKFGSKKKKHVCTLHWKNREALSLKFLGGLELVTSLILYNCSEFVINLIVFN